MAIQPPLAILNDPRSIRGRGGHPGCRRSQETKYPQATNTGHRISGVSTLTAIYSLNCYSSLRQCWICSFIIYERLLQSQTEHYYVYLAAANKVAFVTGNFCDIRVWKLWKMGRREEQMNMSSSGENSIRQWAFIAKAFKRASWNSAFPNRDSSHSFFVFPLKKQRQCQKTDKACVCRPTNLQIRRGLYISEHLWQWGSVQECLSHD